MSALKLPPNSYELRYANFTKGALPLRDDITYQLIPVGKRSEGFLAYFEGCKLTFAPADDPRWQNADLDHLWEDTDLAELAWWTDFNLRPVQDAIERYGMLFVPGDHGYVLRPKPAGGTSHVV